MQLERPCLILVGGAPASGKTTLAEGLARELGMPLFRKDEFKEVLYDALQEAGVPIEAKDPDASHRLGLAAVRVLYRIAGDLVAGGTSCVLESNFHRGLSEPDLAPLLARVEGRQVHCAAPREVTLARFRERDQAGERHPVHTDLAAVDELEHRLDAGEFEPLDLPVPTLRVDTSDGFDPPLPEVVRWVRSGGGES